MLFAAHQTNITFEKFNSNKKHDLKVTFSSFLSNLAALSLTVHNDGWYYTITSVSYGFSFLVYVKNLESVKIEVSCRGG